MTKKILIADDDPHIREVVTFTLAKAGMEVQQAKDGKETLITFQKFQPDLMILDVGMPEMDGLEVCREIRKFSSVPILFLSARDEEIDRIVGLEIGGDDYVTKPFSPREVVARVGAILKRSNGVDPQKNASEPKLCFGKIEVFTLSYQALYKGDVVDLTAKEFAILEGLIRTPLRVFDRDAILTVAYADNIHVSDRTIDSHIRNIRKKFADAGCESVIETVHGVGYRLGTCL